MEYTIRFCFNKKTNWRHCNEERDYRLHIDKWWIIVEEAKYYKLFVFNMFFTCVYFRNWDLSKSFECNQFQKSDGTCKLCENITCQDLYP